MKSVIKIRTVYYNQYIIVKIEDFVPHRGAKNTKLFRKKLTHVLLSSSEIAHMRASVHLKILSLDYILNDDHKCKSVSAIFSLPFVTQSFYSPTFSHLTVFNKTSHLRGLFLLILVDDEK